MRILLVVSNYNESGAIIDTLEDIKTNAAEDIDVLVIDNCSSDDSLQKISSSGANYLVHPVNTGGSAGVIKTAFYFAHYHDYDIYCHMDGDNQHIAAELHKILSPILENKADIVIGSRFLTKEGFQSHFLRRIGIRLFSSILSMLTKTELSDITSGFRAYNRRAINYFAVKFKHEFEASIQLILVAHYANLKMMEVPVTMRARFSGKSEFNLVNALKFPIYGFINLIGTMLQKH